MTIEKRASGFYSRLRYGASERERFKLGIDPSAEGAGELAAERDRVLHELAAAMVKAKIPGAREKLEEAASVAGDAKKFAACKRVVEKLVAASAAAPPSAAEARPSTFRAVADAWVTGKLTAEYPDSSLLPTKTDKSRSEDRAIVETFYPAIGDVPVAAITLDDIDRARRAIPRELHPNTRRRYVVKLRSVLRIAAGPLRLTATVPEIDIPPRVASNLFGYLYPQEEALLLGCRAIPLIYRVLYGYLARNGCRVGESVQITWDHVDLETGDIHIDKRWTKTQRARRWVLDADVLEAFERWYEHQGRPDKKGHVFPSTRGKGHLHRDTIRNRLTDDLRAAGVTRKSILEGGDGADALRVHDLRASFVTLALRAGWPHKRIMARTGHETLGILGVYDRLVQDAEEHRLPPWFSHMARTLPEFAGARKGGPRLGHGAVSTEKNATYARPAWTAEPVETGAKSAEIRGSDAPRSPSATPRGPAEFQGVGHRGPASDEPARAAVAAPDQAAAERPMSAPPDTAEVIALRIEESLAADLKILITAGRYELAEKVMSELRERRLQRTAPAVTVLADARAKKQEKP